MSTKGLFKFLLAAALTAFSGAPAQAASQQDILLQCQETLDLIAVGKAGENSMSRGEAMFIASAVLSLGGIGRFINHPENTSVPLFTSSLGAGVLSLVAYENFTNEELASLDTVQIRFQDPAEVMGLVAERVSQVNGIQSAKIRKQCEGQLADHPKYGSHQKLLCDLFMASLDQKISNGDFCQIKEAHR